MAGQAACTRILSCASTSAKGRHIVEMSRPRTLSACASFIMMSSTFTLTKNRQSTVTITRAIIFSILAVCSVGTMFWWEAANHAKNIGVVQCPERSVEELEQAVIRYFNWKLKWAVTSRAQAEAFFRTHQFHRNEASYAPSASTWIIPFTMITTRDNTPDYYVGMVTCGGGVELGVRPRHWK